MYGGDTGDRTQNLPSGEANPKATSRFYNEDYWT